MPDLNTILEAGEGRQPQGAVLINGVALPWVSFQVDSNAFFQADTFSAQMAVSKLPAGYGMAWFAAQDDLRLEIFAGFPRDPAAFSVAELDSLILGRVDDFEFNPVARTLVLSGRDLTSAFIDAKTSENWRNQTASEIVAAMAARHGMTVHAQATTTKVGSYYEIDHARLAAERSEWDVLCWLAHEEGFQVYVKGEALYFEPLADPTDSPYVLRWQAPGGEVGHYRFNGTELSFKRSLTVAKDVVVEIRSWNPKQKKAFSAAYPVRKAKGAAPGASGTANRQIYRFTIPGLTPEQALQRAQSEFKKISMQEMKLDASMPADNILDVTKLIEVRGTGTVFDQTYYTESVVRRMSKADGYKMTVTAKNSRPETAGVA